MIKRLLFRIGMMVLLAGCVEEPLVPNTGPGSLPDNATASVVDVIDGDTIDVYFNNTIYRVRYIGVNTPERDEVCYEQAAAANEALVEGKSVTLVKDVSEADRYGRLLRYVYVGGMFVNAELVAQGYAEARDYPPDTAYSDYLESLETTARQAGLGCHPMGVFGG